MLGRRDRRRLIEEARQRARLRWLVTAVVALATFFALMLGRSH
jgi:hypothetical protein